MLKSSWQKVDNFNISKMTEPIPYPIIPYFEGNDPLVVFFKEWSDSDYNSEKWDFGKGKDKHKTVEEEQSFKLFEDPQEVYLPSSLANQACYWKRPSEIFYDKELVIFVNTIDYPDLISGSNHLLHSEIVRSFISSIEMLQYLGNNNAIEIEGVTSTYTPTTNDMPWRPWHHVYSNCKAGKNQVHRPMINQMGKYIVRLFWMGSWRKIYVDDKIPVNESGDILLPSFVLPVIEPPRPPPPKEKIKEKGKGKKGDKKKKGKDSKKGSKKSSKKSKGSKESKKKTLEITVKDPNTVELWPYLLMKAIFKLASLTWKPQNELVDFDIVQCLTGWIPQQINTKGLSSTDIWEICFAYGYRYLWPSDKKKLGSEKSKKSGTSKKSKSSKSSKSKDSKKSKGSQKSTNDVEEEDDGPWNHVVIRCNDLRHMETSEIMDISPCWSHDLLIDQTRNIPLTEPEPWPELPLWKTFRWIDWAVQKNILPPHENMDDIKCFKIVSNFRNNAKSPPSKTSIEIRQSIDAMNQAPKSQVSDKTKSAKGDKKSKKEKKPKGKKGKAVEEYPDPSIWIDCHQLCEQIQNITIYFKPVKYTNKFKISDIKQSSKLGTPKVGTPKGKGKGKTSKDWRYIPYQNTVLKVNNEPLYIFVDSIDTVLIMISISQLGNYEIFYKDQPDDKVDDVSITQSIDDSCYNLIMEMKKKFENVPKPPCEKLKITPFVESQYAYLVCENFNWNSVERGETVISLKTTGTKSAVLQLQPGRRVFTLWIKSDSSFNCNLIADTNITIGTWEEILEAMSSESQRLQQLSIDIASNYGKLVQAFGMPEFPIQLRFYFESYKPNRIATKKEMIFIHDFFYNTLLNSVKLYIDKSQQNNVIRALNILFRKIYFSPEYRICKTFDCLEIDDVKFYKVLQDAAIKLEALFKGIYVRSILKRHNQDHREYLLIFELCKKVYTAIFSAKNRLNTGPVLLRNFLLDPSMEKIAPKYDVFEDLKSVVTIIENKGSIIMPAETWMVVCRYILHVNSCDTILINIKFLFSDGISILRVFNNDTNQELKCHENNNMIEHFSTNINGYTILCYGYSDEPKTYFWKLMVITQKTSKTNIIIMPFVNIKSTEIFDNYLPNSKNHVFRCIINVKTNTFISMRVVTSYKELPLHLLLLNPEGERIYEGNGMGRVLVPIALLKANVDESKSSQLSVSSQKSKRKSRNSIGILNKRISEKGSRTSSGSKTRTSKSGITKSQTSVNFENVESYYVDVFIQENSWPLNLHQWIAVEAALKRQEIWLEYMKSINFNWSGAPEAAEPPTQFRNSDKSDRSNVINAAHWTLQVIYNEGDYVDVVKDRSEEEHFRSIKMSWWEEDPLRHMEGTKLRNDFYNYALISGSTSSSTSDFEATNFPQTFDAISGRRSRRVSAVDWIPNRFRDQPRSAQYERDPSVTVIMDGSITAAGIEAFEEISVLKNPFLRSYVLPEWYLAPYFIRGESNENIVVLSLEDVKKSEENILQAIADFNENQEQFIAEMEQKQMDNLDLFDSLREWYDTEIREESEIIMNDVFQTRQQYIDAIVKIEKFHREWEKEKAQSEKVSLKKEKKKKDKSPRSKK